jgi:hypothetical protein
MPVWCPKCNAMLPEGLEECPRCGASLTPAKKEGEIGGRDVAWLSAYTIGILVIPLIVGLLIGLACVLIFFIR